MEMVTQILHMVTTIAKTDVVIRSGKEKAAGARIQVEEVTTETGDRFTAWNGWSWIRQIVVIMKEMISIHCLKNPHLQTTVRILNFVKDGISTADFDLYQNSPNPFNQETVIGFVLPKDMSAEWKIYDVTGKTLKIFSGDCVIGYNSVQVDRSEVQGSGILYYTLENEGFTATKKMVLVE
jgi:hypothetical protein